MSSSEGLARRTAVIGGVVMLLVVLGLAAWKALPALLLLFGSVLVALLLGGLAAWLARRTPLGHGAALAASGLAIVAALVGVGWFVGSGLAEQVAGVGQALPAGLARAEAAVREAATRAGAEAGAVPPVSEALPDARALAQRALGIFGTAVGALGGALVMVLLGVFLAARPETYRQGLLHLAPPARRARLGETLDAVGRAVRKWLVARLILMTTTFALTWAGLSVVGVPFAAGLAVFSALLAFVPYVGAYVSGAAAVLVAFIDGPQTALYTALLYVALENVHGLTIEPLVEARLTAAPPGLLLAAQVVLGVLLGIPGIVLASPLTVAATVVVQMLYVEDALGDSSVRVLGAAGSAGDA